ncbi:MAG: hypothetical protein ABDI19_10865 [Armatimonadota bacterium]
MRTYGGIRWVLILLLLVVLAGIAGGGWWWLERNREYPLRLQLKAGDTLRYAFEMNLSAQGQTVEMSLITTQKVLKVQKDGSFVIRTQMESGTYKMNGMSMPAPSTPPQTDTFRPNGQRVRTRRFASPLEGVMEMHYPDQPVKIGSRWKQLQRAPDGSAIEAEYEVVKRERVRQHDTLKIAVTVRDVTNTASPYVIMSGHQWVDLRTGMPVRVEGQFHQVRIPGIGTTALQGTLRMRLLSSQS